jgi:glycogen operon protein
MGSNASESVVRPGTPHPLGATWLGDGTNFAVFSANATRIDVCLYGDDDANPYRTISLPDKTNEIWHGFIEDVHPGTRYLLRAHGEHHPRSGHRFNSAKALIDPYAKAIDGKVAWHSSLYSYELEDPEDELVIDATVNDAMMPKCLVIDEVFDWGEDRSPNVPWLETVIYETHVKGMTRLHPQIPEEMRGTYKAFGQPAITDYFSSLGVTTVELLPVHSFVDDNFLVQKSLSNYWGYSTLGYFAPESRYSSVGSAGGQVNEFKEMVRALHVAGLEVILDVVYNHTCEGNHLGPTLSFRGLDNANYYRLLPDNHQYYLDFTGTGNSLNVAHPQVLTLIMDSLRYWVTVMHVDGFRFDLATTIGRETYNFDPRGAFFDAIHQDPILSQVKLIAEPWDIGEGGYQVGNFPLPWSEWNDRFRDGVRSFWQLDNRALADMGYRLTGSSDLYERSARGPQASINMVTAHDGFTLNDVVSYNAKHNAPNGEFNQDGHSNNVTANYGAEGPTTDPTILDIRARQQRNMLATLMLSQGVPMLLGGDEINRTQQGNNNAYCQDDETSWFNWDLSDRDRALKQFLTLLTHVRKERPLLRRRRFFKGRPERPASFKDASWLRADGQEMTDEDWNGMNSAIALRMAGDAIDESDARGMPITEPTLLLLLHAGLEPIEFMLPSVERGEADTTWTVILDTDSCTGESSAAHPSLTKIMVPGRTVMLLEGNNGNEGRQP